VPDRAGADSDRELPDCLGQQPYGSEKIIRKKMADKTYESLKIENIVASGVISGPIDLVNFSENVEHCELNKKRFPGAVYRIPEPKIA
jgi:transcription initiation factor TFIID TATA-box-binding protein